jgi:type VI secretion system protein ImpL
MNKALWLKAVCVVIGVAALLALLWFAAPLVKVGDAAPFDSAMVRLLLMVLTAVAGVLYVVYDVFHRIASTKRMGQELAGMAGLGTGSSGSGGASGDGPQDDSDALKLRMTDALATLRKTSSAKGDYLYDLPWYVIIGPPGSGKTTALVNSGLKFPLSRGGQGPAAIAGEGGTRYCDWWFTEEAVLIDTAGRYTTQDSDSQKDKSSWLSFLDLLRRNRPKQPINGVFVCISIEDLLKLPEAELRAHSDAIRARLVELHDQLKVDFPVYALFTKADLISGFMEFFGHLPEEERKAVWGVTFQTNDKTANMIGHVPEEFDLLIERLNQDVTDRVHDEPNPQAKIQIFGFPSQMSALKQPVFEFLNRIFEQTRYHTNATLRGFYFTSGTQEGTPIDQLVGALARSFGAENVGAVQYSGRGKSFFLTDLLQKVVFDEAGWVSTNVKAVRRNLILKTAGYSALGLVTFGLAGAWWWSYRNNSTLIGSSYASVTQYKTVAGPLRDESVISDHDFARVVPALHHLRNMPAGYQQREVPVPVSHTVGLNQKPRLNAAAESAYETGLQRLLRPRVMFRLEDQMRSNITNPGFLVDALRIYMMVTGREPMEGQRVLDWARAEFATLYPGAGNAAGRQALMEHMSRLIELDPAQGLASLEPDANIVQEAQAAIGRMSVADRAFELLRSNARSESERDWVARRKGGQDTALVFEGAGGVPLDNIRVPFFYTYAGFHEAFLGRIGTVADQVRQERRVLGDVAAQAAVAAQYDRLPQALYERYSREFVAAWQAELRKLRIRLLTADKPRYPSLQAAASPTSPITQLIETIREETALTKEKPAAAPSGQPAPLRARNDRPAGGRGSRRFDRGRVPGLRASARGRSFAQTRGRTQQGPERHLRGADDAERPCADGAGTAAVRRQSAHARGDDGAVSRTLQGDAAVGRGLFRQRCGWNYDRPHQSGCQRPDHVDVPAGCLRRLPVHPFGHARDSDPGFPASVRAGWRSRPILPGEPGAVRQHLRPLLVLESGEPCRTAALARHAAELPAGGRDPPGLLSGRRPRLQLRRPQHPHGGRRRSREARNQQRPVGDREAEAASTSGVPIRSRGALRRAAAAASSSRGVHPAVGRHLPMAWPHRDGRSIVVRASGGAGSPEYSAAHRPMGRLPAARFGQRNADAGRGADGQGQCRRTGDPVSVQRGHAAQPVQADGLAQLQLPGRTLGIAARCHAGCSENCRRSAISLPSMRHVSSSCCGRNGCRAE